LSSIIEGTAIDNSASIYFDFNSPVVTNTTINTIALGAGINQGTLTPGRDEIQLRPNPANESVIVSVDESMLGGTLVISDIAGKKITTIQLSAINSQIATDSYANGVYFITVDRGLGRISKKLIIER
jgi:hypothetical protein